MERLLLETLSGIGVSGFIGRVFSKLGSQNIVACLVADSSLCQITCQVLGERAGGALIFLYSHSSNGLF